MNTCKRDHKQIEWQHRKDCKHKAAAEHACPFAVQVANDKGFRCTCCECCAKQCEADGKPTIPQKIPPYKLIRDKQTFVMNAANFARAARMRRKQP